MEKTIFNLKNVSKMKNFKIILTVLMLSLSSLSYSQRNSDTVEYAMGITTLKYDVNQYNQYNIISSNRGYVAVILSVCSGLLYYGTAQIDKDVNSANYYIVRTLAVGTSITATSFGISSIVYKVKASRYWTNKYGKLKL